MKLHVDQEEGALHLQLCESEIIGSEEVAPGVIVDYNKDKEVIGIEVLYLTGGSRKVDLSSLLYETL